MMNSKLNPIRYASPYFLYILSFFTITNIFGVYCTDLTSLTAFFITTTILCVLFYPNTDVVRNAISVKIFNAAVYISLLVSFAFESFFIQNLFALASEENTGTFGKYILGLFILLIAYICSLGKSYTALKVANIVYIIPVAVIFIAACSLCFSGIDVPSVFKSPESILSKNIIYGILASIILFSDSYIINIMQKNEKCYSSKNAIFGLAVSSAICTVLGILLNGMFGKKIITGLSFPVISALGTIPGFDFEEVILFAASIFIIYRFTCKLCVLGTIMLNSLSNNKKYFSHFFIILTSSISVVFGTTAYLNNLSLHKASTIIASIYAITFIFLNILSRTAHKRNDKHS